MIIKAEERILILAPRGRDAEVMQQVLSRRNSACHLCLDLGDLRLQLIPLIKSAMGGLQPLCRMLDRRLPFVVCP